MSDEGISFYLDEGGTEIDRETVVMVDSNHSFPEIETMGSEEPEDLPLLQEQAIDWIEVELVDEDGHPMRNVAYHLALPDGSVRRGKLDVTGRLRIDGIASGECKLSFPELGNRVSAHK